MFSVLNQSAAIFSAWSSCSVVIALLRFSLGREDLYTGDQEPFVRQQSICWIGFTSRVEMGQQKLGNGRSLLGCLLTLGQC